MHGCGRGNYRSASFVAMKNLVINMLALIGFISVGKIAFDVVRREKDAKQYLANCENIRLGMTLDEAKKVMGDYDYYLRANRSEIWTYPISGSNDVLLRKSGYYLTYPVVFGASSGTEIHFDPITQKVIGVVCDEKPLNPKKAR